MLDPVHHSRSGRFSPLRYPGGKGEIVEFVRQVVRRSGLSDGLYVEPYAGCASVAIELLLTEEVSRIAINDLSPPIYSFWNSVLHRIDDLCKLVRDTPLTVEEWDRQKAVLKAGKTHDRLRLGFAAFYLNRTNRSGILNAGIIGGRAQTGKWLIGARFNRDVLVAKIEAITNLSARITVSNEDAVTFISEGRDTWGKRTLVYLDPPYYAKGKHLYHHYYSHADHEDVRQAIDQISGQRWMVSYDDTPEIAAIYEGERWLRYTIGYSAREHGTGREVMFFGPGVDIPRCSGSMVEVERSTVCEAS